MKLLDISVWQTDVDYAAAAKDLDGVILRAGYGKGNEDQSFIKHYSNFSKYNVPIGVYWFSYATTVEEARNEAIYCVAAIHNLKIELPVCYDFEDDSVKYAKTKGIKVTKQLATRMAEAFLTTIEENGYYAMLYSNPNFLKNYYDDLSRYDLWLAHYFNEPDLANPPRKCGIWQYGTSEWPGFNNPVDINEAYKDYPKIIREAGLNHLPKYTYPIGITWALKHELLTKEEIDTPVTKGDVAQMIYAYHGRFGEEDAVQRSGLLER